MEAGQPAANRDGALYSCVAHHIVNLGTRGTCCGAIDVAWELPPVLCF